MPKLQVKTTVIKLASLELGKFHFKYDEDNSFQKAWRFSRTENEIVQFVSIEQSDLYHDMIIFDLSTTADRAGITGDFLEGKGRKRGWTFADQESLEKCIQEMLQIVIDKGLEWFEISATPLPKPSMEICGIIMENPHSLSKVFSEKYSLDVSNPTSLKFIEEFFQTTKMRKGNIDWGFISEASAFLGEVIRMNFGGNWSWDSQFNEPSLVIPTQNLEMREYPLDQVLNNCMNPYVPLYFHYKYLDNVTRGLLPILAVIRTE